jgi:hypothetical protein
MHYENLALLAKYDISDITFIKMILPLFNSSQLDDSNELLIIFYNYWIPSNLVKY